MYERTDSMSLQHPTQPDLMDLPRKEDPLRRIVRFAYEIGSARSKPRGWTHDLHEDLANVAEHTYRVTFLSMLLAKMEGADVGKAAMMSMVHDTDEIRGMDLTPYQKPYVTVDSEKAVRDTFADTPLAELCLSLFAEYKDKECLESHCVKDADILDTLLELAEITARGNTYVSIIQDQMSQKHSLLRTQSAKDILQVLMRGAVNPWDWFLKGPSTFKDGTYGK